MALTEVGPRLHVDKGPAGRISDHPDAIPGGAGAERLRLDIGHEGDLGADVGEHIDWRVLVVRLATRTPAVRPVGVDGALAIAHEVDHPDRPVVIGWPGGEVQAVVAVDDAVGGVATHDDSLRATMPTSSRATIGAAFWF